MPAEILSFALVAREHVEKLGARIRERREELGLSQDELARKIGLKATGNYVSRWERAQNQPDDDYIELIARALNTDIADLWAGPLGDREKSADTPALLQAMDGGKDDLADRLDRIEQGQDAIAQKLDYLFELMDTAADEAADAETQANGQRSARTPGRRTPGAEPPAR